MLSSAGNNDPFKLFDPNRFQIDPSKLKLNPIEHYLETVASGAPPETVKQAEEQVKKALSFQDAGKLSEQFNKLKEVAKQLVNAQGAFQNLKLKDRVIADNRDKVKVKVEADKPEVKADKAERGKQGKHAELELIRGRLQPSKDKPNVVQQNNLPPSQTEQRSAQRGVIDRLLSSFERVLLERFEQGRQIVQHRDAGKPVLPEKSLAEWQAFFSSMGDRSVGRKLNLADVRDFLFRGLVMKGDKAVVIADAQFNNGKVEKFIRFQALEELLGKMRELQPGQTFSKEMLESLSSEELMVLALAVSQGEMFEFSPQAAKGKFLLGSIEERAQQELGLRAPENKPQQRAQKSGAKGRGGLFSGRWHDKEVWEEEGGQFIPWWSWGKLPRKEKTEAVRSVFYMALIIVAIIGILALTYKFF